MFSLQSKISLARSTLFQDQPVYVQFYITARCNLTCNQCNIIYAILMLRNVIYIKLNILQKILQK